MRKPKAVAMSALVLIATACSGPLAGVSRSTQPPAAAAPSSAIPSVPTIASIPSGSPSATGGPGGAGVHGPEGDIPAPCIAGGPTVLADAILWIACELTGGKHGPAQILEYDTRARTTRVLHRSAQAQSGISQLRVSDAWVLWAEYTDLQQATDTRIYAKRRSGGDAILLDDAQQHGALAHLMETALDGSQAYWSLPLIENGEWHGRLMQKSLPDGTPKVAMSAPKGSIITWPSARGGAIAYERSSQSELPQTRVVVRLPDGPPLEIGKEASSEPSLGDGFVAYKQAERYDQGELRAYVLSGGKVVTLGPGEAPNAFGGFVTWQSSTPTDSALRLAAPVTGCVNRLGDLEPPQGFPYVGLSMLAWTHADPTRPGPEGFRIRYVSLQGSAETPCKK